jgi:hypothetical protein
MIGKRNATATRSQRGDRLGQGAAQQPELLVHSYAQRLEDTTRRVSSVSTRGSGNGTAHHLGQLTGARHGTIPHHRSGYAPGKTPLAVVREQSGQLVLVPSVHHVGRSGTYGWVHPHVEGPIVPIGEAPFRGVQLQGTDPQVEEHPAEAPWAGPGESSLFTKPVETGMADGCTTSVLGQALRGHTHGLGITIETQEP